MKSLVRKLRETAEAIPYLEKRGVNQAQHYSYVQAVDVVAAVRRELLARGVILVPGATEVHHLPYTTAKGAAAWLTTAILEYRFIEEETGEMLVVQWAGAGSDTGGDKGLYKAFTGGLKYMLQTTFLLPMTEDPERDGLTNDSEQVERSKDAERPAAPVIPMDRANAILTKAIDAGLASMDGTAPTLSNILKAKLVAVGVPSAKIGALNVDQAEDVERFLVGEAA